MNHKGSSPLGLYTIGIAALFLAGFFLLVLFGAQNYRNTVAGQNENMKSRALLSYLSTALKAYDEKGAIEIGESDYGQVLVIHDGDSGYAVRIYRYENQLVEDYAQEDAALAPGTASVIGETNEFKVEGPDRGVLNITTDAGHILLHLRSEGSGV